jgi:hypothetical protein
MEIELKKVKSMTTTATMTMVAATNTPKVNGRTVCVKWSLFEIGLLILKAYTGQDL